MAKKVKSISAKIKTPSQYTIDIQCQQFFAYGNEFKVAADCVNPKAKVAKMYLYGHAIELYLKVYLAKQGVKPKDLKKSYGHNIEKLLNDSIANGLSSILVVSGKLANEITAFNNIYQSKGFEYFNGIYTLAMPAIPNLAPIKKFANDLSKKLSKAYFT